MADLDLPTVLNLIDKRFKDFDTQISSGWLSSMKEEVDRVPAISSRIDHAFLEINNIRDIIYDCSTDEAEKESKVDPVSFLRTEVEALRLITRRMESHNAGSFTTFSQIHRLNRKVDMFQTDVDQFKSNISCQVSEIKDSLKKLEDFVTSSLENMEEKFEKSLSEATLKIAEGVKLQADNNQQEVDSIKNEFSDLKKSFAELTEKGPFCNEKDVLAIVSQQVDLRSRGLRSKMVSIEDFRSSKIEIQKGQNKLNGVMRSSRTLATTALIKVLSKIDKRYVKYVKGLFVNRSSFIIFLLISSSLAK